jgi:hypothetical protein
MVKRLKDRSKDSEKMIPYWNKTDAIVQGHEAIRLAGADYLPKFSEESEADYKDRLALTKFTNIYRDVLEGLASKPFESEIRLENIEKAPQEIKDFIEDVDGSGNNITVFSSTTFFNGINSAISWVLIDYPEVDKTKIKTLADQKASGLKPYWSHILARNVLEVRTEMINGKESLSYIRIFEPASNGGLDHIRVFEKIDNVVNWVLYVKNPQAKKDEEDFVKEKSGKLSIDVIPVVPFATGRRDGKSFFFFPAMQDAADLQITLYQDESALQFIKTMAGYPMLAANGMKPEYEPGTKIAKKLAVGPRKVLYGIPDGAGNHGTWTYVEPSAQSMQFLKESIKDTKQDLRELGRQPLTATTGQLTAITTQVAAGKARSAVSAWALLLKDSIENAMVITAKWMGLEYEAEVVVYDDFDNLTDNTADLDTLNAARDRGDISLDTYWNELKRRKVLSLEFKNDEERKNILNEVPGDDETDLENDDDENEPAKQNL